MEATSANSPPLRLLSLDGGGIRGLSELYILEAIMHRVKIAGSLAKEPLPADYFDLICGTSTGGLIAILLGRLRLSVSQAIQKYGELSKHVFSEQKRGWQDGKFKASKLEEAIRKVLIESLGEGRDDERMVEGGQKICKTFVCAVPARQVNSSPRLFRSYVSKNPSYNPKIWEAARATSAAPSFFKRISIGEPGVEEEFVDGAVGYNNPVQLAIQEAVENFDTDTRVSCIVSIGTGKARLTGFKKPGLLQRVVPVDLIKTLAAMATSSETASKVLEERYRNCPGLYHRLNVETGLSAIALGEWVKLSEVKTHTMAYLETPDISRKIDVIVSALLGRNAHSYPLGSLDGTFQITSSPSITPAAVIADSGSGLFFYPTYAVVHFVNRTGPLNDLDRHFSTDRDAQKSMSPIVVVIQGMGGCGKSQLALEYCKRSRRDRRFDLIFWIDATSPDTAMQSFTIVAARLSRPRFQASEGEANLQFVRRTLCEEKRRWLLVFDNFDEPKLFNQKRVKEYFPDLGQGSIIVTSRQGEVRDLGHHALEVNQLSEEEALEILLRRTKVVQNDENLAGGKNIARRLGYHALAIDQAGAYIRKRGMDFLTYLDSYNRQRQKVLNEAPQIWDYMKSPKDSPETLINATVFTTLELSLDSISGLRGEKEHLLTLMAFFDVNKLTDTLFIPYGTAIENWMTLCREIDDNSSSWNPEAFRDILVELHNLSLLQSLEISSSEAVFSLHPLIQDWLKARLSQKQLKKYFIEGMLVLSEFIWCSGLRKDYSTTSFARKQVVLAHIEAALLNQKEIFQSWKFLEGSDLINAGYEYYRFLAAQGRDKQAEELCRAVLEARSKTLEKEHPENLIDMHNLAGYLQYQGKYKEAESLIRECLAVEIKVRGKEHTETLKTMIKLTSMLIDQDRYIEANAMSQEAVELAIRLLGRENEETIISTRILAEVMRNMGDYSEAERLNIENLAVSQRVIGEEHPQTFFIMSSLALVLTESGKFDEAEPVYREVLSLMEDTLGKDHPETLIVMYHLAINFYRQKKLAEAEELFWRAYPGFESAYGWNHRTSIWFLGSLATCLENLGKHQKGAEIRQLRAEAEKAQVK